MNDKAGSSIAPHTQDPHRWMAPGKGDRRSPCPMVNALANHGFLPRNGLSIDVETLVKAAEEGVNLDPAATRIVGKKALETSSSPSSSTFNLDDLNKHGVIEHDGSLSRADIHSGDNHTFNPEIWASVKSHFRQQQNTTTNDDDDDIITLSAAAKARAARLAAAKEENPEFNLDSDGIQASLIETALYLSIMVDGKTGEARREWVEILFEQERLHDDFKRPEQPVTTFKLVFMAGRVLLSTWFGW